MDTVDRLRRIVAEVLGIPADRIRPEDSVSALTQETGQRGNPSADATFIGDFGADSLNVIELMLAIEQEFALEMSDSDAEDVIRKDATISQIADYIDSRRQ